MRDRLVQYQEAYGALFNLEATPAESTTYRLAKHDKKRYPDIISAAEKGKKPYYTNSSHLPVGATDDILKRSPYRTICRCCIPPARYSTPIWVKNCLIGSPPRR